MRCLIVLAFVFYSGSVFSQCAEKYPILVKELNEAFQDDLIRGDQIHSSFTMDSLGVFKVWAAKCEVRENILLSVLLSTKERLSAGNYYVNVYWDLYSNKVYSVVGKPVLEEGFPNYSLYDASPSYGYGKYMKVLQSDIISKFGSIDSIKSQNWYINIWYKKIEIHIDKQGKATYLSTNPMVNILDSTKRIRWSPALYYGSLRNSIKSFNLSLKDFVEIDKAEISWKHDVFVLDDKFKDELIRFEEDPREIPYGIAVVSFVLNPHTDRFENPFVHRGDINLAKDLIHWIQAYDFRHCPKFCVKIFKMGLTVLQLNPFFKYS